MPTLAWPRLWIRSTRRRHCACCSSFQRPRQPGVIRASGETQVISAKTSAAIETIAVGAISEADHANSILAAGRADLCAIARPHLANPQWTLLEAAKIGYHDLHWPVQYLSGKNQLERNIEREKQMAAQAAEAPHERFN